MFISSYINGATIRIYPQINLHNSVQKHSVQKHMYTDIYWKITSNSPQIANSRKPMGSWLN